MRPELKRSLTALAAAATMAVGLAACGSDTIVDSGAVPTSTGPTTSTSPQPTSSGPTRSGDPTGSGDPTTSGGRMTEGLPGVIVLQRSGGLRGAKDRLELRPDGSYTVLARTGRPVTRQLDEPEQAAVVAALKLADLARMKPPTRPPGGPVIADGFTYILSAGGQTVTLGEPTPAQVRPLLSVLGALFSAPAPTR
jgi:hypothetical protein